MKLPWSTFLLNKGLNVGTTLSSNMLTNRHPASNSTGVCINVTTMPIPRVCDGQPLQQSYYFFNFEHMCDTCVRLPVISEHVHANLVMLPLGSGMYPLSDLDMLNPMPSEVQLNLFSTCAHNHMLWV